MDEQAVWHAIDEERRSLALFLDELTEEEWETPSLCAGWRVREVAAHLTLAHVRPGMAVWELLKARGSLDRMIHNTAVQAARRPVESYAEGIRAMIGSRRKAPGISHLEPLIDALVHGQDMAVPLGRDRPMPVEAAMAAADRVWAMGYPFGARKAFAGVELAATDCVWRVGSGRRVEGPIAGLLLLITGRGAVHPGMAATREKRA
ncbi:maleylpyruvate isomerase family mycothiol-dependent enzyme [Herbidospora yilanensis]|uniref:maleylpyruvate isomerase family mycothiol-dependent enzyme n=1 Tax=Herbidospora yilanensis TaxID=354426 RepID=UPI00078244E9|nr:maleylpyruvate isomerase family mycothiol-dependent enzyme [Herbidospora yilanensis]